MLTHNIHGHRIEVADDHTLAVLFDWDGAEVERFTVSRSEVESTRPEHTENRPLLRAIRSAKIRMVAAAKAAREKAEQAAANNEGEK